MDVHGRVALVTGASSGIGRAVAERLAAAGARVLVHGRDEARTTQVADEIGGTPLLADLSLPPAADDLAAQALAVHGRVDLLVANAGSGWSGPFLDMGGDEIDRLLALDLRAPVALVRALLPGMVERRFGHLVLVGSVAGRTGVAGEAVYAAAKAGVDGFAESLRLELHGSGVGLTVVVPAAVSTPFFAGRGRPYERRLPRPVGADRVADAAVRAVQTGRAEVWVPGWLRVASTVRGLAPSAFRSLSVRFGEQVRARAEDGPR